METSGILKIVYAIIVIVVTAALGASFTHMHDWTMHVLPPATPDAFGWVNAVISELTPLAGSLYLIYAHKNGLKTWPAWLMLGYGGTASAIGQVHAAGDHPTIWALIAALLPVVSAFILIKVLFMLLDHTAPGHAVKVAHEDLSQLAQEMAHHPAHGVAQTEIMTALSHPEPPSRATPAQVAQGPTVSQVAHDETAAHGPSHPDEPVARDRNVEVAQDETEPVAQDAPEPVAQDTEPKVAQAKPRATRKPAQRAKVSQGSTDPAKVAQAVEAVSTKRLTQRAAAAEYGVSRAAIQRAMKDETTVVDPRLDAEPAPTVDELAEMFALPAVDPRPSTDET